MDEAFEKLRTENNNTVENLIKWLKDSKLIENSKEAEEKARKLFADVEDATNVHLDTFKQAVTKLAEEQKKNLQEFFDNLAAHGPKFLEALMAAAAAYKETLAKDHSKK